MQIATYLLLTVLGVGLLSTISGAINTEENGVALAREKRFVVSFVTNIFKGSYEMAKKAAAFFIKALKAIYKFVTYQIKEFVMVYKQLSKKSAQRAQQVIDTVRRKIEYLLKKTFIISGDLKNAIIKQLPSVLPTTFGGVVNAMKKVASVVSWSYENVFKYVKKVYSQADSWTEENKRMEELAKKEGGRVYYAEDVRDFNRFIPNLEPMPPIEDGENYTLPPDVQAPIDDMRNFNSGDTDIQHMDPSLPPQDNMYG